MAAEEAKDPLKDVDRKNMGNEAKSTATASGNLGENGQPIVKKWFPKKIRQIPEFYFLHRRSLPSGLCYRFLRVLYCCWCWRWHASEVWINKKVKEDGGIIWEFDK